MEGGHSTASVHITGEWSGRASNIAGRALWLYPLGNQPWYSN